MKYTGDSNNESEKMKKLKNKILELLTSEEYRTITKILELLTSEEYTLSQMLGVLETVKFLIHEINLI